MNHIPRKPTANAKIIVDDLESKLKIMELSEKSGLSMKAIVIRLINQEYEKLVEE
jgi:hypothetical protein